VTTRRPLGPRFASSAFAAPALALALFASACGGTSDGPSGSVAVSTDTEANGAVATTPPLADAAPEAAQEPAEAPEPAQDPQGDTSITAPATDDQGSPPVTSVPPAPTVPPSTEAAPAPTEPPAPPAATVELPAVDVVDLVSGDTSDLSSLAKPGVTLVWFWAPH